MPAQDSGLAKRGLVVFGLIALITLAVGYMLLYRRGENVQPKELPRAEPQIAALIVPIAGFPASLSWQVFCPLSEQLPSAPGWETRYTATRVLAHRGSPKLPLGTLREMLDENQQRRNFRVRLKDQRIVSNEGDVQQVLLAALKSLQEWLKHPEAVRSIGADNPQLRAVYAAAEKLTEHPSQVIKNEAVKVRLALNPK
jgi:hypothetical protein